MMSMFGPNGQRVLALIAAIPGLSADQVDQVTVAWKQGSPDGRGRAWANLNCMTDEDERYRILAAASLARREALETARRADRADWAFWAAACDAGLRSRSGSGSAITTTRWSPLSRRWCPSWPTVQPWRQRRHPTSWRNAATFRQTTPTISSCPFTGWVSWF
jgi:hypothetical protein